MFFFSEHSVLYTRLKCSFFQDPRQLSNWAVRWEPLLSINLVVVIQRDHILVCMFCLSNLSSTLTFLTFFNLVNLWYLDMRNFWQPRFWYLGGISTAESSPRILVGLLNVRRDSRVFSATFCHRDLAESLDRPNRSRGCRCLIILFNFYWFCSYDLYINNKLVVNVTKYLWNSSWQVWRYVSSRPRDSLETFQNLSANSLSIALKVPFANSC